MSKGVVLSIYLPTISIYDDLKMGVLIYFVGDLKAAMNS
jgi:hypothetical protein